MMGWVSDIFLSLADWCSVKNSAFIPQCVYTAVEPKWGIRANIGVIGFAIIANGFDDISSPVIAEAKLFTKVTF